MATAGRAFLMLQATAFVGAIFGGAGLSVHILGQVESVRASEVVELPLSNVDLEVPLEKAVDQLNQELQGTVSEIITDPFKGWFGGRFRPPPLTQSPKIVASQVASKLKEYRAQYNKPGTLYLGETAPVELVIPAGKAEDVALFKSFDGEIANATLRAAKEVSAQLTGSPDRLEITLRGDKMRTISDDVPVTWVWDVKPLKPGKTAVTLEVTSYIKIGKDKAPVPFRVLQDTWTVEARGIEWAKYQIERIAPVQAFVFGLGGTIVAVLAWFGIKGWGGGKKSDFET
jgi:hypothetical protein